MRSDNRSTRNMRLAEAAHEIIDKKLAKVNLRRVKRDKLPLSKGDVAAHYFNKTTLKELESL